MVAVYGPQDVCTVLYQILAVLEAGTSTEVIIFAKEFTLTEAVVQGSMYS